MIENSYTQVEIHAPDFDLGNEQLLNWCNFLDSLRIFTAFMCICIHKTHPHIHTNEHK